MRLERNIFVTMASPQPNCMKRLTNILIVNQPMIIPKHPWRLELLEGPSSVSRRACQMWWIDYPTLEMRKILCNPSASTLLRTSQWQYFTRLLFQSRDPSHKMAITISQLTDDDIPGAVTAIQQAFADDPYNLVRTFDRALVTKTIGTGQPGPNQCIRAWRLRLLPIKDEVAVQASFPGTQDIFSCCYSRW